MDTKRTAVCKNSGVQMVPCMMLLLLAAPAIASPTSSDSSSSPSVWSLFQNIFQTPFRHAIVSSPKEDTSSVVISKRSSQNYTLKHNDILTVKDVNSRTMEDNVFQVKYIGCLSEPEPHSHDNRMLSKMLHSGTTFRICATAARRAGMRYFGVEAGWLSDSQECWAANKFENDVSEQQADQSECQIPCHKDEEQNCGGSWHLSAFSIPENEMSIDLPEKPEEPERPDPRPQEPEEGFKYIGCMREPLPLAEDHRLLINKLGDREDPDSCAQKAMDRGFKYFGLEWGGQCFAEKSEMNCGGYWRLAAYAIPSLGGKVFKGTPRDDYAITKGDAMYYGCFMEPTVDYSLRLLPYYIANPSTIESCRDLAKSYNMAYFGIAIWIGFRLNVYGIEALGAKNPKGGVTQTPPIMAPAVEESYKYVGCIRLEIMRLWTDVRRKRKRGNYKFFGLEYGGECWADNDFPDDITSQFAAEGDCNMPCTADASENCGGFWRISVYAMPKVPAKEIPTGKPTNDFDYVGCLREPLPWNSNRLLPNILGYTDDIWSCAKRRPTTSTPTSVSNMEGNAGLPLNLTLMCLSNLGSSKIAIWLAHLTETELWIKLGDLPRGVMPRGEPKNDPAAAPPAAAPPAAAPKPPPAAAPPAAAPKPPNAKDYKYVGCLREPYPNKDTDRILEIRLGENETLETCGRKAFDKGLKFFGLEAGGVCFADEDFPDIVNQQFARENECYQDCRADPNQDCGGQWRLLTFAMPTVPDKEIPRGNPTSDPVPAKPVEPVKPAVPVKPAEPVKPAVPVKPVEPAKKRTRDWLTTKLADTASIEECGQMAFDKKLKFFGLENGGTCFAGNDFALNPTEHILNSGDCEDTESCALKAANKGYAYFGLQNGGECYGDKNFVEDVSDHFAFSDECNMACSKASSETCGGPWRLTAYAITSMGAKIPKGNPARDEEVKPAVEKPQPAVMKPQVEQQKQ
ncbi:hypothetical protein BC829DRAFT_414763 [Chytridium lagenaria]|nr:hypothetical protein BC829DRAFT_414763 [Chytridium lagenaria]